MLIPGIGWVYVGFRTKNWGPETGHFGVRKLCFRTRQVGAFCKFRPGHTGGPFIFWQKTRFFRKMCRLRGWCNITPWSGVLGPLFIWGLWCWLYGYIVGYIG